MTDVQPGSLRCVIKAHPAWKAQNEKWKSPVQTADLSATIREYFHLKLPKDMQGKPLRNVISKDTPVTAPFGDYGEQVTITDGRYIYEKFSARISVNRQAKGEPLWIHIKTRR